MEPFLKFFFSQGVLGVIAVAEFLIILGLSRFFYGEIKELNAKLLQNAVDSRNALTSPLQKLQETSDKIIDKMEQSNDLLIKLLPGNKN